jgi:hypothetical protein
MDRSPVAVADAATPVPPALAARTAPVDRPAAPSPAGAVVGLAALAALALLVAFDGPTTIRLPLGLVAVMYAPGAAIVGLLALPRSAARAALTIAVSLSVAAVVSQVLLLGERLTASNGAATLLLVTTPFAIVQVARARGPVLRFPTVARSAALDRSLRVPAALTAAAALCWCVAAITVEPRAAGELGMITALPLVWWAGVALLTVGFLLHLQRGIRPGFAMAQVVVLAALLYALLTVAEPFSRIPTSFTHVGLIDYLVRDHQITRYFDARYSWPGSLSLGAMLTQLSGASSSIAFTKWAIPTFVALWSLAVYAVAAAYTKTSRGRWLTVWVFLCLNWVGQDYWSSQALNFFLVVTVVAAIATWFPRRILRSRGPFGFLPFEQPAHAFTTSGQGLGLLLCLVLLSISIATSHQLSPFTLVGVLAALWLVDRRDIRLLPVLAAIISLAWISWGADDYWIGHLQRITGDVGHVTGVVTTGTVDRIADGSAMRRLVLGCRLALTGLAWGSAGLWVLHSLRRGRTSVLTLGALAVVPLGFVALQSYGGELGLRIFLFSLPFVALLLADAIDAALLRERARGWGAVVALTALGMVAVTGFVVARYGNEQFEQTYPEDMAVVDAFVEEAPLGSFITGTNTSNAFRKIAYVDYVPRKNEAFLHPEVATLEEVLYDTGMKEGYVIVAESTIRESYLAQGAYPGWEKILDRSMDRIGAEEVFRQGRAVMYRYAIDEVGPVPEPTRYDLPFVTAATRRLLHWPALSFALATLALLLLTCALHVTGVRWQRPGWLEGLAVVCAGGVVFVVFARFVILT